jgi:hypothetical protein
VIELAAASSASSASIWDQPGTLGFLVVFGMGIILYFLLRSMSRHLRKVNEAARVEAESAQPGDDDGGSPLASGTTIGPPAANGARRRS